MPISWLFQDSRYSVGKVKLCHGDCVLFYTDGITETKNKNREEYGEERFFNVVEKYKNSLSDKELLDKLVEDVSEFRCGSSRRWYCIIKYEGFIVKCNNLS